MIHSNADGQQGQADCRHRVLEEVLPCRPADSDNSAVHESLALLFKSEAGVEYVNTEPEMPPEDFGYQPPLDDISTQDILDDLDAIAG